MSLLRLTFNNNKATGSLQLGGATAGQGCSDCPSSGLSQMLLRDARERTNSSSGHLCHLLRWDTWVWHTSVSQECCSRDQVDAWRENRIRVTCVLATGTREVKTPTSRLAASWPKSLCQQLDPSTPAAQENPWYFLITGHSQSLHWLLLAGRMEGRREGCWLTIR